MHVVLKLALVFILDEEIVHIMLEVALVFILKEEIVHIVLKAALVVVLSVLQKTKCWLLFCFVFLLFFLTCSTEIFETSLW